MSGLTKVFAFGIVSHGADSHVLASQARGTMQTFVQNPQDPAKSRETRECVLELVHNVVNGTLSGEEFCRIFTSYESIRESAALKEVSVIAVTDDRNGTTMVGE